MSNSVVQFVLKAVDQTAAAFASAQKRMSTLLGQAGKLRSGINSVGDSFSTLGVAVGVGAFAVMTKESMALASSIDDARKQTGLAVGDFQGLAYAAEQSGSSTEELTSALTTMNRTLAKAKAGDSKSINIMKDLGIDPKTTKDAQDFFLKLADSFKNAGQSSDELGKKTAVLKNMKLDPSIIQLLDEGSASILKMAKTAADLGLIMSEDVVESLANLEDKLGTLKRQTEVSAAIFTSGLAPALTDVTDAFLSAGKGGDFLKEMGVGVGEVIKQAVIILVGAVTALYLFGKTATNIADTVMAKFLGMGRAIGAVGRALVLVVKEGPAAAMAELRTAAAEIKQTDAEAAARIAGRNADAAAATQKAAEVLEGLNKAPAPKKEEEDKKTPKPKPLGNTSLSKDKADKPEEIAKAQRDLVKAQVEAVAKIRTEAEKELQDKIKFMLDEGQLTYQDYYQQQINSQQRVLDFKLEALRVEEAEEQKNLTKPGIKEKDKLESLTKIAKLNGDIKVAEMERADIAGKAAREQIKDERELAKAILDVQTKTKELLNTMTTRDRQRVLDKDYEDAIKMAQRSSNPQDLADVMEGKRVEGVRREFEAVSKEISEKQASFTSQVSGIDANPSFSLSEKRIKIADANREAQASIEALLPELRKQAELLGGEYVDKLRDAETALQTLKNTADTVAETINTDIVSGLSDGINGIINGEQSPAQALQNLFKGVGKSIAKMVSDDLASSLYTLLKKNGLNIGEMFSGLMSGGSGSTGLGAAVADMLGGKSSATAGLASKLASDASSQASTLASLMGGGGAAASSGGGAMASIGGWLTKLFGFQEGGWTGDVGESTEAGVVHGREFVFSAPAVRTIGRNALNLMHQQARRGAAPSHLDGLANGGFASDARNSKRGGLAKAGTVINNNIYTKDAPSFNRSQAQFAATASQTARRAEARNK